MTWTQPICSPCWEARNPGREPIRLKNLLEQETCCWCGNPTQDGIFVRVDPKTVNHPRKKED